MDAPRQISGPTRLASFTDLAWTPGTVDAWSGDAPPEGVRVSSVCAFLMTRSARLLLVEVLTRGWDLPGGHVEVGESPLETLRREVREEAGLGPDRYRDPRLLGWFHIRPDEAGGPGRLMLVHVAELDEGLDDGLDHAPDDDEDDVRHPRTEVPHEVGAVRLFDVDDLPASTRGLIWAVFLPYLRESGASLACRRPAR